MSEHSHAVNATVTGLSALPGTAQPFAAARAMTRFLNHDHISFHALLEPSLDAVRTAIAGQPGSFVLVVHDWCMFNFNKHNSKTDRYARSHKTDLGYELGTALAVDASDGRPLGPLEFRLRTANGMLSTRIGGATLPPGHIDEIADCMAQDWQLARTPIHIIDREADSVGHYRRWHAANHHFVVRANGDRVVQHNDCEKTLSEAAADLSGTFVNVLDSAGQPGEVTIRAGTGVVQVAESAVILHRPARRYTGKRTAKGVKKQIGIPGVPLPLRL
ncbi:MAG: hypothetical protein ACKO5E_20120, partial [bacterium]